MTDKIAWEYGRRVEIRVPCSSVCLGSLNKCKSTAVISRRSFTAGIGRPNAMHHSILRIGDACSYERQDTQPFHYLLLLNRNFEPSKLCQALSVSLSRERIHSSQQFDIIFFFSCKTNDKNKYRGIFSCSSYAVYLTYTWWKEKCQ